MELDILHRSFSPFIIDFHGALFSESSIYFCIEYMDAGSLDRLYPYNGGIPEAILSNVIYMVLKGLYFLSNELQVAHRDVKPRNILANTKGEIKLCDFGISGGLLESNRSESNVGCYEYIAPERIASSPSQYYSPEVSDIWSLGITVIEMATAYYPYTEYQCDSVFAQAAAILQNSPPQLPSDKFDSSTIEFVDQCLQKDPALRPDYPSLLNHTFITSHQASDFSISKSKVADWVCKALKWYKKGLEVLNN